MLHVPVIGIVAYDAVDRLAEALTLDHRLATRVILGSHIAVMSETAALQFVHTHLCRDDHLKLAFCNAHTANLAAMRHETQALMDQFTILPDGLGIDLASGILYGAMFPANLNGTDFVPRLFATSPTALNVLLLGSHPGVAARAASRLQKLTPQHRFGVLHHGYFDKSEEAAIVHRLNLARPDVLLVAMGNPAQEAWIARHCSKANCRVAIGVGALFDFLAGDAIRAPWIVRTMRMEWLWRLGFEPVRLFRRYVIGNPLFLFRVLQARLRPKVQDFQKRRVLRARQL
jgi:exopolysaccharide biosynthesis WecB/TagA/CpsF family protein